MDQEYRKKHRDNKLTPEDKCRLGDHEYIPYGSTYVASTLEDGAKFYTSSEKAICMHCESLEDDPLIYDASLVNLVRHDDPIGTFIGFTQLTSVNTNQ